jgi:hypothetical protein
VTAHASRSETSASPGPSSSTLGAETIAQRSGLSDRHPRRRRRIVALVVGVVAVGAVIGAVVLAPSLFAPSASGCSPPVPQGWSDSETVSVASCGSKFEIPADSYTQYGAARFSDGEIMLGQYSSPLPIGAYLLNSSEVSELQANPHPTGPPSAYVWSCGDVLRCDVNADVPPSPGAYFLVLENLNTTSPAPAVWTETLEIVYHPENGY